MQEQNTNQYEIRKKKEQQQYESDLAELNEKRETEKMSQEEYNAQLNLLKRKKEETDKKIEDEYNKARLNTAQKTLGGVAKLVGENTAMGKAAGIAQATINTYQGVTEVWKAPSILPATLDVASKVVGSAVVLASGLQAVQNITAVKTPKAKAERGMKLKGKSHSQGGIDIKTPNGMIEAEGGEVIINKRSVAMFPELLSRINQAGGGVPLYANGGVVPAKNSTILKALQVQNSPVVLDDTAIDKIASAIYDGSQRGIVDLSDNRQVVQEASF